MNDEKRAAAEKLAGESIPLPLDSGIGDSPAEPGRERRRPACCSGGYPFPAWAVSQETRRMVEKNAFGADEISGAPRAQITI